MGAVTPDKRESSIPPAPVSCPSPDKPAPATSKRKSTLRRPGSSQKNRRVSARAKAPPPEPTKPFEPSTGRYATVPEAREEVVLQRNSRPAPSRAPKTTMHSSAKDAGAPRRPTQQRAAVKGEKPRAHRIVPHIAKTDVGKTKLGPRDAFLLSRIDGVLAVDDLADLTGMRASEILESLEQLAMLGLVRF